MAQSRTVCIARSAWRDLKRDWQSWSRAEHIAAECIVLAAMLCAALFLSTGSLP
ncbi:MAG: hypothetical protein KGO02_14185 [Alphaproteobacteria bacterium]|nr:hypothetical protein [Alphaproteobacteria bacterium]